MSDTSNGAQVPEENAAQGATHDDAATTPAQNGEAQTDQTAQSPASAAETASTPIAEAPAAAASIPGETATTAPADATAPAPTAETEVLAPAASTEAPTRPQPRYGEYAPEQPAAATAPSAQPQPAQPAQPTQPYPPQYGQGYGGPAYDQQQAYQQAQYQQYAAFMQQKQPKQPKQPKPAGQRSLTGRTVALIAAGLVVAGLVGGGVGSGIAANIVKDDNSNTSTTSGPANITVNNPSDATQITAVAASASPSVVTISVTSSQESGTGSGVLLTDDGYVVTNTHVVTLDGDVADATIQVQTNDGKLYSAKVVGTDPTDDLAVIKLDGASGLKPIQFADSSKLNVGQQVIAIGAPLGLAGTVTDGIVSALNRSISIASSAAPSDGSGSGSSGDGSDGSQGGDSPFNFWNFGSPNDGSGGTGGGQGTTGQTQTPNISLPVIQTDASINPGNSGGALLNTQGQLVGINVAIASTGSSSSSGGQSGSIGVGFAIPANVVQRIANELKAQGSATHGLLGATVGDASAESSATTVGASVQSVTSGGAAEKAGLKAGDVITNFNGVPITSATDLTAQVRSAAGGSKATVTYVRGSATHDVTVTLGTYDTTAQ